MLEAVSAKLKIYVREMHANISSASKKICQLLSLLAVTI